MVHSKFQKLVAESTCPIQLAAAVAASLVHDPNQSLRWVSCSCLALFLTKCWSLQAFGLNVSQVKALEHVTGAACAINGKDSVFLCFLYSLSVRLCSSRTKCCSC